MTPDVEGLVEKLGEIAAELEASGRASWLTVDAARSALSSLSSQLRERDAKAMLVDVFSEKLERRTDALLSARAEAAGLRAQRDAFEHLCRRSLERGEVIDAEALDCFHILTTERPKATDADRAWAAEVASALHPEGVGKP